MVFAFCPIIIGWIQVKQRSDDITTIFGQQLWHWSASLMVVSGAFQVQKNDRTANTGLVILLMQSLATVLDGLRIRWRFIVAGLFLGYFCGHCRSQRTFFLD